MSIFTAILLGLYYWFGWSLIPTGAIFFDPLPASLFIGVIMGDVPSAVMAGATIQMIYMGLLFAGGQTAQDSLAATIVSVPMVLTSGMDPSAAIAVAIPIGLICAQLANLQQIVMAVPVHMADKYAAEGNTKGLNFALITLPLLLRLVVRALPLTILVYFGGTFASGIANAIPEWLMNALAVVGGVMPAVGFSIVAFTIGRKEVFPFLIAGFFVVQYTGMSVIAASLLGLFLAFLYWYFVIQAKSSASTAASSDDDDDDFDDDDEDEPVAQVTPDVAKGLVSKKTLRKCWLRWTCFALVSESYERKTGPGFCYAMVPALQEIYKDDEDGLKEALVRHMTFFNTESDWGSCLPGMAIAMEEQKEMGAPITGNMIVSIKTGLMGPFAGIGDACWGMFEPMILGLFLGGATQGDWTCALFPLVIFTVLFTGASYYSFNIGYKSGTSSAHAMLGDKGLGMLMPVFAILGMFMMGALAATYVTGTIPITFTTAAGETAIQSFLDSIAPGLVSFAILMFPYWITKKYKNFLWTALIMLAIGLVLGALGILA